MNVKLCVLLAVLCFTASVSSRYVKKLSTEEEEFDNDDDDDSDDESSEESYVPTTERTTRSLFQYFGTRKVVESGRPVQTRPTIPPPPTRAAGAPGVRAGRPGLAATNPPAGPPGGPPVDPPSPPPRSRFSKV